MVASSDSGRDSDVHHHRGKRRLEDDDDHTSRSTPRFGLHKKFRTMHWDSCLHISDDSAGIARQSRWEQ